MAKLLELIEKKHKTVNTYIASIAGNAMAPPINAMTPTEGVVLKELYGIVTAFSHRQFDWQN